MSDRPTILVPIQVLEGESIPEGVPALLANAHVVLLGYHVVPDQTAPGQARLQFEDRATNRLDEFKSILEEAGATVDRTLVFTHKAQPTIDRMIYEHECLAVLVPNATGPPAEILVPIRGTIGLDRLTRVISGLFATTDVTVTLYHSIADNETEEDAMALLEAVQNRLFDHGFDTDRIDLQIAREEDPLAAITALADDYDAVVMGESDPSIVTYVFGMQAEQVAERFLGPVIVVQRERPSSSESPESPETTADEAS